MKKLFLLIMLTILMSVTSFATKYYFSATGSDGASGTSPGTAWRTITMLNASMSSMVFGDSVLFKKGDEFYGSIIHNKSGIKFGVYGTGSMPTITGMKTITGFTAVPGSPGLYVADFTGPNDLRYVTLNGSPVKWGTTPEEGLGLASWLNFENYTNGTSNTITDRQLTNAIDRTGNRFIMKSKSWATSLGVVISHTDSVFSYRPGFTNTAGNGNTFRYPEAVNWGYRWCGNRSDVDHQNEWCYDSVAHKFYFFFGSVDPNTQVVKASGVDILVDMKAFSDISYEGIRFEGANKITFINKNSAGHIKIKNFEVDGAGSRGTVFSNFDDLIIEDGTFKNVLSTSIRVMSTLKTGCMIQRVKVINNSPFESMFYAAEDIDGDAIVVGMNNSTIQYCSIDQAAYSGLWFTGSHVLVYRNRVRKWSMWLNDCGAIYTHYYSDRPPPPPKTPPTFTDRHVINNYCDSGTANPYGYITLQKRSCKIFYNDDGTMEVEWINNVGNGGDIGFASNNNNNVSILHNIIIASQGINFYRKHYGLITNLKIIGNIISNVDTNTLNFYHVNDSIAAGTIASWLTTVTIDSNFNNGRFVTETYINYKVKPPGYVYTLYANIAGWRTATTKSANDVMVPYKPISPTGRKLVVNWSDTTATFPLLGNYSDDYGVVYNGSITLAPYGSALLYYKRPVILGNVVASVTTTPISCYNGNSTATVSATGGTAPYTYSWNTSPVQTTSSVSVKAGTYRVIVTDAVSLKDTVFVTISQPDTLILTAVPGVITVNGGNTNVVLNATGGTSPYTFTGSTVGVLAGTYTYTVTDTKGCTASKTITITQPSLLSINVNTTTIACNGGSSTVTVNGSGGVTPYTGTGTFTRTAGTYGFTIVDANGATASATVTITQPTVLVLSASWFAITINGGSTNVTLTATGGTGPYTYVGPTSNIVAGTYIYTVTDARGCTATTTAVITQPTQTVQPVILSMRSTNLSCYGVNTGTAAVTVTGGVPPYTYSWNSGQTTSSISSLPAGTYTVTVVDAANVRTTGTRIITSPALLVLNVNYGSISKYGGYTTVFLSATGGTFPYTFTGQTVRVYAGTYTYTVTDARGCVKTKTVTILQPSRWAPKSYISGAKAIQKQ